jgi:hypothetical protein
MPRCARSTRLSERCDSADVRADPLGVSKVRAWRATTTYGARVLRAVCDELRGLNEDNVRNFPAARRAVDSGAAPKDLVLAMTAASYEVAFRLLLLFTSEHVEEGVSDAAAGWTLAPVEFVDDDLVIAESDALDSLHEGLLGADPTGLEGSDLFA